MSKTKSTKSTKPTKPTIAHDLLYIIGDNVERIREEEREDAFALFVAMEHRGNEAVLRRLLAKVPQIDKYRIDYWELADHRFKVTGLSAADLLSPSDNEWKDGVTPIDYQVIRFHDDIHSQLGDKFKMLLKAGSVPCAETYDQLVTWKKNYEEKDLHPFSREHTDDYEDEPIATLQASALRQAGKCAEMLKDIDEHRLNHKTEEAKKTLALNKILSDRLVEASSAADAGEVMDIIRLISETLVDLPVQEMKHWVPRAQKKKKKTKKKKKKTKKKTKKKQTKKKQTKG